MQALSKRLSLIPDKPIYHYTSQDGLLGILQERVLWASSIRHLNDARELTYGFGLLEDRINEIEGRLDESETQLFSEFKKSVRDVQSLNIFVCSFSEKGNLLSQWRAYCPTPGGFSIGFDYDTLKPLVDNQGCRLVKCIYDQTLQNQVVDEYIEWAIQEFKTHSNNLDDLPDDDFLAWLKLAAPASGIAERFVLIASLFKDPAFEEEDEWRIISRAKYDRSHIGFRKGPSFIVPFYKFSLAKRNDPVRFTDIYVGPTPHPELSRKSVSGLITCVYGREHMDTDFLLRSREMIKLSHIPYRTW